MFASALFSFLGGAGFRMIFGEVAAFFNKKQEAANELALMKLQGELDLQRHANDMERLRVQSELGVKEIQVKGDIDIEKLDAQAFIASQVSANKPTGIPLVDGWNGIIRPLAATIAIGLWVFALINQNFAMAAWDMELVSGIIGWFFANRHMAKNGK